ncbi:MAG: ABC transporter permease [Oscillospiraceae bacterium]
MKNLFKKAGFSSFLSSATAIVIGILFGFIVLLVANPSKAVAGLGVILQGGFVSMRELGQMLYDATPIILTGLSVGLANKCGLFNIGGSGQFIVGGFAAVYVGVKWTFLPAPIHWVVALLASAVAGAIWGLVPGILKALSNINEVIACIMMNYIGMSFVNMMVRMTIYDPAKNQSRLPTAAANIPKTGLDSIFVSGGTSSSANGGILIAILLGVVVYIVLNKTKFGFEMKACGLNSDAARYAGINEKKSIISSMVMAGALAGLGGGLSYLAGAGKAIHVLDQLAAEGFNGIPVALLGMSNPIAIIFSGLFIAYLTRGGFNLQTLGYVPQVIDIITAVIIYFAAFTLLFQQIYSRFINKDAGLQKPLAATTGKTKTAKTKGGKRE